MNNKAFMSFSGDENKKEFSLNIPVGATYGECYDFCMQAAAFFAKTMQQKSQEQSRSKESSDKDECSDGHQSPAGDS